MALWPYIPKPKPTTKIRAGKIYDQCKIHSSHEIIKQFIIRISQCVHSSKHAYHIYNSYKYIKNRNFK